MFWLAAAILTLIVFAPLALSLWRAGDAASAAEKDVALYKDQLKEVERDLARGVLAEAEAEAARVEVARRLLAADKRAASGQAVRATGQGARLVGAALVVVAAAGGASLYWALGAPGYDDMPLQERLAAAQELRDTRPRQEEAEAAAPAVELPAPTEEFEALAEQLRTVVQSRPDDVQGLRYLADTEARLGNFIAAREAQERVIALRGAGADARDYTDLAELMILATQGYVSPEAEQALTRALTLDARNKRARYYSGLTLAQTGRPDIAYRMWAGLLQDSAPDDPWVPLIQTNLPRVAAEAGIPMTDPALRGPSSEDVAAAQDMTAEERREMIAGMVAGLSERLATEGGTPAEWARLIRAYGVLGETAKASAIWNEAQEVFAGNAGALSLLREAAQAAEVAN